MEFITAISKGIGLVVAQIAPVAPPGLDGVDATFNGWMVWGAGIALVVGAVVAISLIATSGQNPAKRTAGGIGLVSVAVGALLLANIDSFTSFAG